jgi:hypothetical protein
MNLSSLPETLVSIDMSFGNNIGHSATTISVDNASVKYGSGLGTIIGSIGSRVNFTNSQLQKLFDQFVMVESTKTASTVKTEIQRKYIDKTSLLLQSFCVLVRGKDISPDGKSSYDGYLAYYGEIDSCPKNIKNFPLQGPVRNGGALILGNIYSEISETDEITNVSVSLIYQNRRLIPSLSYNYQLATPYYLANVDLAAAVPKYGYTLSELRQACLLAGVSIVGLPNRSDILFETSGTLESVLTSIANTLGYYVFVNPFTGQVNFIDSAQAASQTIINPTLNNSILANSTSCSFTESAMQPIIISSFLSKLQATPVTVEYPNKERIARFKRVDFLEKSPIKTETLELFYGAHVSKALNESTFNAIVYYKLSKGEKIDFGNYYTSEIDEPELKTWSKVYPVALARTNALKAYKGPFNLETGKFLKINQGSKKIENPSDSQAFKIIASLFEILDNTVYVSNKYSEWKALRMQFTSGDGNVSGPYSMDTSLEECDGLQSIHNFFQAVGDENFDTLEDVFNQSKSTGDLTHGFVAVKPLGNSTSGKSDITNQYTLFSEKNFIIYETPFKTTYAAFSPELWSAIDKAIESSKKAYKDREDDKPTKSLKQVYTRLKRPVNEYKDRDSQEASDDREAERTEDDQKVFELLDKVDFIKSNLQLNGSTGHPTQPVQLEVKTGKPLEIEALKRSSFSSSYSSQQKYKASSRTVVGIEIPSFKITLTSLSFKVGAEGITTTISESTVKLLDMDQEVIKSDGQKAIVQKALSDRLSARQRNAMRL